jgi:hypothetical protein
MALGEVQGMSDMAAGSEHADEGGTRREQRLSNSAAH